MIQTSVRQQADVSAAMAVRLNKSVSDRLWTNRRNGGAHPRPGGRRFRRPGFDEERTSRGIVSAQ